MTESTETPSGVVDQTSKSTTVRTRNGGTAMLTRGEQGNYLTIRDRHGVTLTAILGLDELRALLVPREQCCSNCKHARASGYGATRCHERLRSKGGQVYAPAIPDPKNHVCGKFEQLVKPAPRQVAA